MLMEFIFKSNNIKEGKVVKFNRNSDITKNMKLIEWMKNEILNMQYIKKIIIN